VYSKLRLRILALATVQQVSDLSDLLLGAHHRGDFLVLLSHVASHITFNLHSAAQVLRCDVVVVVTEWFTGADTVPSCCDCYL
jgi:hypothetical protein